MSSDGHFGNIPRAAAPPPSGPRPSFQRKPPRLPIIGANESIIAISSFWARHGQRGAGYVVLSRRTDDPLYRARRTLHTGADLLTTKQTQRLHDLFTADEHVQVEATWTIYQRMSPPTANPTAPEAER